MLRLGCGGCLVALVLGLGLAAGAAWVGFRGLQDPEVKVDLPTADDGFRGQQKIFSVFRAGNGRMRARPLEVTLSEREINGFLSRHLAESPDFPLASGTVKLLGDGRVELLGRLPLRHVTPRPDLVLPAAWLDRPVWIHVRARASLEVEAARGHRRYLRLDVERYALGRQWLPGVVVRPLLSRGIHDLLRWPLPAAVEAITIDSDRIVVRTAS
jgi:hypothetical protein